MSFRILELGAVSFRMSKITWDSELGEVSFDILELGAVSFRMFKMT